VLFDPGQQVSIQVIILFNGEKQKSERLPCFCISADNFYHAMHSQNVHAFKTSACGVKAPLLLLWFEDYFFFKLKFYHLFEEKRLAAPPPLHQLQQSK